MGYRYVRQRINLIAGDVIIDIRMLDDQSYFAAFHRAKLIQVLYEAVSSHDNGRIHVKKRLVGLERLPTEEMKLTFYDGTTATADLVIGADGIRSVVRSLYVKDTPVFSGYVAYRGLPPMDQVRKLWPEGSDVPSVWTQQGKHIVTYSPGDIELIIDIRYQPVAIC